ncbi:MAG: homoserine dehydrogenase [Anaerolineales bacterium]
MQEYRIALIGFGNVGQAFARLLLSKEADLAEIGVRFRTVAIATGSHGSALAPDGIDLGQAVRLADEGREFSSLATAPTPDSPLALIDACNADVLFENTPVDYLSGQPGLAHVQAGLEASMHVITANKGPVVHGYRRLTELAARNGRRFLFESTVMDGAPVFGMWRSALPLAHLQSFRGVLNSTTNLILTRMEAGDSFDSAVAYAQSIGIAETDPSGDIEGWDAAIKVAALATVLMDRPTLPSEVQRHGIEGLSAEEIQAATAEGLRWKLICQADRTSGELRCQVGPEKVDRADPIYSVSGTSSAITFHSDVLGALTLTENDPGPHTTAYGLLADFVSAVSG